jgi:hypothetical protein
MPVEKIAGRQRRQRKRPQAVPLEPMILAGREAP